MTYKEYDNIQLENSNTTCPATEECELRNNSGYIDGTEMGKPTRNAGGIVGNTRLMLYTTENYWGASVRNGNYIYIGHSDFTNGFCEVIEYNILTNTTQTIILYSNPGFSSYKILLSIIEDRKILAYNENDDYNNVYILDFETSTTTLDYSPSTNFYPINLMVIKTTNNDLWLYVISQDSGAYNIEIAYKNYTQNGSWNSFQEGADSYGNSDTIIIGERYLTLFYITSSNETIAIVTDITDNSHGQTNVLSRPTIIGAQPNWNLNWATPDNESTTGYVLGSGIVETNLFPLRYTSVEQWIRLDPTTRTLTDIYNRIGYNLDSSQTYGPTGFSTITNAYIMRYPEKDLYRATDLSVQGLFTIPLPWYSTCHQMDDNGSIWWYSENNKTLYRNNLDGSISISFSLDIEQNYGGGIDQQLLHARDSIIMLCHEQEPSSYNHFYRWYYIT